MEEKSIVLVGVFDDDDDGGEEDEEGRGARARNMPRDLREVREDSSRDWKDDMRGRVWCMERRSFQDTRRS